MAKNLIIKTTMDNRDFDKKYTELTKKLQQTQKEQELLNNQTKRYKNELSDVSRKYDEMSERAEKAYQRILELQEKSTSPNGMSGSEYLELENLTAEYEKMSPKLDALETKQARLTEQVDKQAIKEQKVKDKVQDINDEVQELVDKHKKIDFSNISKDLNKTIKSVAKWGLALFGIRAAYSGIRQAISYVSQYNEELANKIESIKYSLAMALEPVIEKIVNLVYTLVQYIGYLAKAWFNVDIFANASAKSSAKAAKAVKSLAGFDTANTLSDSSAGGSSPIAMKGLDDSKVPDWLIWIKDNGIAVAGIIGGIAAAIVAVKLGVDLLTSLGIGLLIAGIAIAIQGIVDFIKDPSWENFKKILEGIVVILVGVAALTMSWIPLVIALVVALVVAIVDNWDAIKSVLITVGDWIWDNVLKPVVDFFKATFDTIWSVIKLFFSYVKAVFTYLIEIIKAPFVVMWDTAKGVINSVKGAFTNLVNGIKKLFTGDLKGALLSFKNVFKNVFDGLWSIVKSPLNLIISGVNAMIKGINKLSFDVPDWIPVIGGQKWGFNLKEIPKLATGGIVNNPGRGIPVGGAIAGEAGREGVLPLTDSQAMSELGKEIGKWISVNVDLTTKLDSRVLSRSLEKVQKTNSFMRNGV